MTGRKLETGGLGDDKTSNFHPTAHLGRSHELDLMGGVKSSGMSDVSQVLASWREISDRISSLKSPSTVLKTTSSRFRDVLDHYHNDAMPDSSDLLNPPKAKADALLNDGPKTFFGTAKRHDKDRLPPPGVLLDEEWFVGTDVFNRDKLAAQSIFNTFGPEQPEQNAPNINQLKASLAYLEHLDESDPAFRRSIEGDVALLEKMPEIHRKWEEMMSQKQDDDSDEEFDHGIDLVFDVNLSPDEEKQLEGISLSIPTVPKKRASLSGPSAHHLGGNALGVKDSASFSSTFSSSSGIASFRGAVNKENLSDAEMAELRQILSQQNQAQTSHVDINAIVRNPVFLRTKVLLTASGEPKWATIPTKNYDGLFPGWELEKLRPFTLPKGDCTITAEEWAKIREELRQIDFSIDVPTPVGSVGVGVKGVFQFIGDLFHHDSWLGLFRTQKSRCLQTNIPVSQEDDLRQLLRLHYLEAALFSTVKYQDNADCLTVITYSGREFGKIALYQVSTKEKNLDGEWKVVAESLHRRILNDQVDVGLLRWIRKTDNPHRIDLRCRSGFVKDRGPVREPFSFPAVVHQVDGTRHVVWDKCGGGWRRALKLEEASQWENGQGLVATIPQMLAYLHTKAATFTNISSSINFEFEDSLQILGGEEGGDVPKFPNIRRGVKLFKTDPADHQQADIRVAVIFPRLSYWAKEPFYWA